MSRRVFVSFNFKDVAVARNVTTFFQSQEGRCQGKTVFVEKDVSAEGDAAIDAEIRRVMSGCDCALFVVGDDCHNSPWINREAQIAIGSGLGRVAVRAPNTTGGLPHTLADSEIPFVTWGHDTLSDAMNKAKRQGR